MQKLPNKPSELLTVALNDYLLVKDDPRYTINMGNWHRYDEYDNTCHVCLAGSVMAKSLGVLESKTLIPDFFVFNLENKLKALNEFREGNLEKAFYYLGLASPEGLQETVGLSYNEEINDDNTAENHLENYLVLLIGVIAAEGL